MHGDAEKDHGRRQQWLIRQSLEIAGRVTGWIDVALFKGDQVEIKGWLLHPTLPIDSVEIALGADVIARVPVHKLPNVAAHYATVSHAAYSGFSATAKVPDSDDLVRITARGFCGTEPVGYYQSFALRGSDAGRLSPSSVLMKRVSGTEDPASFAQMGLCAAGDLMQAADKHLGLDKVKSLLDFGCGSGRVGYFLQSIWPDVAYSGCDIDAEAVTWCNENVHDGAFKTMEMQPPLPYADASFDVVVAVSVMTHLTREEQHKWLAEVRRVLRPDGLFLPSIHGAFAAMFNPDLRSELEVSGITDNTLDPALDGVLPPDYYRSTFQLPSFTRKEWARHFEVVDIMQAGCGGFQDLVVLRKPR